MMRITRVDGTAERLVGLVPIADDREAAEAEQWIADSQDRWSGLSDGQLRREIVKAGEVR